MNANRSIEFIAEECTRNENRPLPLRKKRLNGKLQPLRRNDEGKEMEENGNLIIVAIPALGPSILLKKRTKKQPSGIVSYNAYYEN